MEKASQNNPLMRNQDLYNSLPSYEQATASNVNQHQPMSQPQRPYPSAPPKVIPVYNCSYTPLVQPQPIYQANYYPPRSQPLPSQAMTIQNHALLLGPYKSYVTCPFCHIQKLTRVKARPSSKSHLVAALMCIFGFWCCVCLPYCMRSCMDVHHYCANCNKFLGTYFCGSV